MAEKIRLKISPSVARFVRPGVTAQDKLSGLEHASRLEPFDRVTLLFCLIRDADSSVKETAGAVLAALPDAVLCDYIQSPEAHPAVLDTLADVHFTRPAVVQALLSHSLLSEKSRDFLQLQLPIPSPPAEDLQPDLGCLESSQELPVDLPEDVDDDVPPEDDNYEPDDEPAGIDEGDEQYLSKFKIAQIMGISEKIKMALSGDKEWRSILIKDANKLVSGSVIKNPRLSDGEVLQFLKLGIQSDEIIRLICANREWIKNYNIRKALINCPKTPLANSLRYLATLNEKDIASYAKSKNVASVISTQAKRMLLAKKR